ncbi:MAG: hypothetical protein FJ096_10225 [Deltaproteobacteria bacterium]|nr:hypothetical protein [Deltaproteobacteria bacterium]
MGRARAALLSSAVTLAAISGLAMLGRTPRPGTRCELPTALPPARPSTEREVAPRAAPYRPPAVRWVAFGGGAEPSSNQVSMEADLELAGRTLGPGGIVLFAGGPGSSGVYELDPTAVVDPVVRELAALFAAHGAGEGRFRTTRLPAHGAATRGELFDTLDRALASTGEPLLVYVDCHGDAGATPADNSLAAWGGEAITVRELTRRLDGARRPVRLLVSACFSGGFSELAFRDAEPGKGATPNDRCGLFASTWDLEATGCDPDPDRRKHEGYAVHLLHALRGQDRDGQAGRVDLDGDGAISLLEAHTRARIASEGLDVPTSTSERWLRHATPRRGSSATVELFEEEAVIAALSDRLGLTGSRSDLEREARRRFELLEARYERLVEEERVANGELQSRQHAVKGELLARWPELDDPWNSRHAAVLAGARSALERYFAESPLFRAYRRGLEAADEAADAALETALERAPFERLVRALENVTLAGRLKHAGGPDWQRYLRFLECERSRLR